MDAIGSSAVALSQVRDEIERMRDMVSKNIAKAYDVLIQYNEKDMEKISERETYIDYLNREISEYIVSLISNEKSTEDSKIINGYYAVIGNLERIGDHAADISEMTILMADSDYEKSAINMEVIKEMAKETTDMVIKSVDAFVNKDLELARWVINRDDVVDDLFDSFRKELIQKINENVKNGEMATDMLMVAKYFERIGDHATNIAEWVIYSITGKHEDE